MLRLKRRRKIKSQAKDSQPAMHPQPHNPPLTSSEEPLLSPPTKSTINNTSYSSRTSRPKVLLTIEESKGKPKHHILPSKHQVSDLIRDGVLIIYPSLISDKQRIVLLAEIKSSQRLRQYIRNDVYTEPRLYFLLSSNAECEKMMVLVLDINITLFV